MLVSAHSKFIRTSPRKIRLVADSIRDLAPEVALELLKHLNQRAATPLKKTLKQAVANAVNNHNFLSQNLSIYSIEVNQGPTYKRFRPVSRGRAHSIQKKTSHIKIVLEAKEEKKSKSKPKVKKLEKKHGPKS